MATPIASGEGLTSLLRTFNRVICRLCYHTSSDSTPSLPPQGGVILIANHTSPSDPLLLAATAGRPIRFLMAREIYERRDLRWVFRAMGCIPVRRGQPDVTAVRQALRALAQGDVVGIFPEGGIDEHREEAGYAGIGYLAIKAGAPIVPAAIQWDRARPRSLLGLLKPGRPIVRYGPAIAVRRDARPQAAQVETLTRTAMHAIHGLLRTPT